MTNNALEISHKSRKVKRPELPNIDTWFQCEAIKKMRPSHSKGKANINNNELALSSDFNTISQRFEINSEACSFCYGKNDVPIPRRPRNDFMLFRRQIGKMKENHLYADLMKRGALKKNQILFSSFLASKLWDKNNATKSIERDLMKKSYLYLAHLESNYHNAKYPDYRYQRKKRPYASLAEDNRQHSRGCPLRADSLPKLKTLTFEVVLDFGNDSPQNIETPSLKTTEKAADLSDTNLYDPIHCYNSPESSSCGDEFNFDANSGKLIKNLIDTMTEKHETNSNIEGCLTPLSPTQSTIFDKFERFEIQFENAEESKIALDKSMSPADKYYNEFQDYSGVYPNTMFYKAFHDEVEYSDFDTSLLSAGIEDTTIEQYVKSNLQYGYGPYEQPPVVRPIEENIPINIDPLILRSMSSP